MRRPRTTRHFLEIHKSPIGDVSWFQSEIIAHSRRNIEPSTFVQVWFWPFITENVLPVVGSEWSGIFPLRVGHLVPLANCNPPAFAGRYAWALISIFEPRNHSGSFGTMPRFGFVVIRQCAIKRILLGREFCRDKSVSLRPVRIIESAITFRPIRIPRTGSIRHRIVRGRVFTDPENRRHNLQISQFLR